MTMKRSKPLLLCLRGMPSTAEANCGRQVTQEEHLEGPWSGWNFPTLRSCDLQYLPSSDRPSSNTPNIGGPNPIGVESNFLCLRQ